MSTSTLFYLPLFEDSRTLLVSLSKMSASAAHSFFTVFTMELLPTSHRSAAVGVLFVAARYFDDKFSFSYEVTQYFRLGSALSPYLLLLGEVLPNLECLVLGMVTLVGGLAVLVLLPETAGRDLPETVKELLRML